MAKAVMTKGKQGAGRSYRVFRTYIFVLVFVAATVLHLRIAGLMGAWERFWRGGAEDYSILAQSLVMGHGLSLDGKTLTAFRPPLYPLFLAGLLSLAPDKNMVVIAQSIAGGLTIGVLALTAVIGNRKYWLGLVVLLLSGFLVEILVENLQRRETVLFSLMLALSGLMFVTEEYMHRWWKVVALGVFTGLACLTRPVAIVGLFIVVGWGWRMKRRGVAFSAMARRILLFVVCFISVLAPWGFRNLIYLKQFNVASTTMGLNLWKGNNPATADIYPLCDVDMLDELVMGNLPPGPGWWDTLRGISELDEVEQDGRLRQIALAYIMENPIHFLRMGFLKQYALWSPLPVPKGGGVVEWVPAGAKVTVQVPYPSYLPFYLVLYFFVILGALRLRDHALNWYLLAWITFYIIVHFITFGETRFRWPLNVLSLPVAARGVEWTFAGMVRGFKGVLRRVMGS